MKRRISTKFLVLFVSTLLIVISGVVLACAGGDDWGDFYKSFFAPEVSQTAESAPFYRSSQTFYKSDQFYDSSNSFDSININEWHQFFASKVTVPDLRYLVYKSRIGEIDSLIFFVKNNQYPLRPGLRKNSVLTIDDKATVKEMLFYLGYAKRCEPFATFSNGWWNSDENDPRDNTTEMDKLIAGGKKALPNIKSAFIRERYIFQIIRLLYNSGLTAECADFYDTHKEAFKTNNTIQYRALGYVAASYYQQKNYSEANLLYANLFDKCETMRKTAYLSFHPQDETDWKASLAAAKTTREKEMLWHLLGLYADPNRALAEICALNPKSDLMDLLLVRAVNIDEESFIPESWNSKDSTFALNSRSTNKSLLALVKKIADAGNTHKPYLWNLSAGYLLQASGNYTLAGNYLDKAASQMGTNELVNEQIRALRIINLVETYKKPNSKTEDELTTELTWLGDDKHQPDLRSSGLRLWALSRLSEKYHAWGDPVKAQCLDHSLRPKFYNIDQNMVDLVALMDKPQKSKFEKLILSIHPYKREDIFEYRALLLLYQYKFKEALAMFNQAKGSGNASLSVDPFIMRTQDCNDCEYPDDKKASYTKYSFVQHLVALQEKAATDPKNAARCYYELANGLYNMTYFGNSRDVYSTPIYGGFPSGLAYFGYSREDFTCNAFNCSEAEKYYQMAMNSSTDKEFKAKCCFMAAKCEQNEYIISADFSYDHAIRPGKYFRQLRSDFSKTAYYNEIIEECGYFRTFLGIKTGE